MEQIGETPKNAMPARPCVVLSTTPQAFACPSCGGPMILHNEVWRGHVSDPDPECFGTYVVLFLCTACDHCIGLNIEQRREGIWVSIVDETALQRRASRVRKASRGLTDTRRLGSSQDAPPHRAAD
jgi:hypothetical protein